MPCAEKRRRSAGVNKNERLQMKMAHGNFPGSVSGGKSRNQAKIFNAIFIALVIATFALFGRNVLDPNEIRWLWIMGLAVLSILQLCSQAFLRNKISFDQSELFLIGFLAYSGLSLAWSPDILAGMAILGKFGLLTAIFLLIKTAGNDTLLDWLCVAISVAVAITLGLAFLKVGGQSAWGGYGNQNFITEFLILAVPFIASLAFIFRGNAVRVAVLAVIAVDLAYLFFFNPSKIEFLVITGIAIIAIFAWGWGRSRRLTIAATFAVIVMVAAAVVHYWDVKYGFRESIYPRLELMINTTLMWSDHPLFGIGTGAFNYSYPLYQERHLAWINVETDIFTQKEKNAGATHNEFIQFLATFGLFGGGLVCGFLYYLLRGLKNRPMTPYAWCGLIATGVWALNAMVHFPLQNPATALLAVIALAFLARQDKPAESAETSAVFIVNFNRVSRMLLPIGAVALLCLLSYGAYRFSLAHSHYLETIKHLNTRPDYAYTHNLEAYRLYPWDSIIRTQLFVTAIRWHEITGKPPFPPAELDRVFNISLSSGPSVMLLLARLQYLLNSGLFQQESLYMREVEQWFDLLRKNASRTPDVLILDTYYQITLKNHEAAKALLYKLEKLKLKPVQKELLEKLRAGLAE